MRRSGPRCSRRLFAPRRSLAWVTDLGHAPQNVRECIRECEVVVVEANHCPELLKADLRRPWATKQRISGRHGHLSNDGARELLAAVASLSPAQWTFKPAPDRWSIVECVEHVALAEFGVADARARGLVVQTSMPAKERAG